MLRDDVTALLESVISISETRLSLSRALGNEGLVAFQAGKLKDYGKANDSIAAMERLREEFTALGVSIARAKDELSRVCGVPVERVNEIWEQAPLLRKRFREAEAAILDELRRAEGYMETLSAETGLEAVKTNEEMESLRKTASLTKIIQGD